VIRRTKDERISHLVESYGGYPTNELATAFERIGKRLGGQHVKRAVACIQDGELEEAVDIALTYYDKKYLHGLSRNEHRIREVDGIGLNPDQLAAKLQKLHRTK
jgi:tRNA 2-selenouridine synthase